MNVKITLPILAALLLTVFSAQAKRLDVSEVPASVINGIKSRHPDAQNIMIDKELHFRISLYQVKYKAGSEQNFALYDSQGRPFGHEEAIDPRKLPASVNRKLEKAFGSYRILSSQIIRHPDGRVEYEVGVKGDGTNWELALSPGGNILTKNLLEL